MSNRAIDIEAAVAMAEAETGTHKPGLSKIALVAKQRKRHRFWTGEEDAFLTANLGKLTIQAIARHLGRSWSAVVIRYKRQLHLKASSKDPRVITGEQVALGLSKDGKSVHWMIDKGILPGRRLAFDRQRVVRVVDKVAFLKWMLNPANWCRFRPGAVGQLKVGGARRISAVYDQAFWDDAAKALAKARRRWKDEWLTTGQVAKLMGINCRSINRAIHKGTLKAVRHQKWWVLRSGLPRKGTFDATGKWVPRILTHQEHARRNFKKFWDDVHAGRRPWFSNGGHNKKIKERERFFRLLGKKNVLEASAAVKVSNPTAYKWLKEKYGEGWQARYDFTRETRKARFLEFFRKGMPTKEAAKGAGTHVESCYRWLKAEYGPRWRKLARNRRAA